MLPVNRSNITHCHRGTHPTDAPSRAGTIRRGRAEPSAQPTDLPSVVDLILGDVKPAPMRIHCRGDSERPLQPRIVARGKALEREATHLVELVDVVLERLVAEKTASRVAECGDGLPSSSLEASCR